MRKVMINWAVAILYLFLTLVMTYPLILHLRTGIPGDLGDPLLNVWILGCETKALSGTFSNLFHLPVFFPHRYTLGYSENMMGFLPVAMPFTLAYGNPALGYNVAFLFAFWTSCMSMYKLLYKLLQRRGAALVGGILFAFAPYRWAQLSHLHILSYGWIPFALVAVLDYVQEPTKVRLFNAGLAALLMIMLSLHTGLFGLLSVGIFLFMLGRETGVKFANIRPLLLTLGVVLVISSAILYPYFATSSTIVTDRLPQIGTGAAVKPVHFLTASPTLRLLGPLTERLHYNEESNCENQLYPGLVSLILAVVGSWGLKNNKLKAAVKSAWMMIGLGTAVTFGVGFYIKLLTEIGLHRFLLVPLYLLSPIRAVTRWMILAWVGLGILAGVGLWKVEEMASKRARRVLILALIITLGMAESWVVPLTVSMLTPLENLPEVYHWLAQQPGDFAILELPVLYPFWAGETWRMYAGLLHNKKLIIGYSGVIPQDIKELAEMLKYFPSSESLEAIADRGPEGLRYVLVETYLPDLDFNTRFSDNLCQFQNNPVLRFIRRFGDIYVFEVKTFPQAETFEPLFYWNLEAQFGDIAILRGYGLGLTKNGKPFVVLDWEALGGPVQKYSATVQAFGSRGEMLYQIDHPPVMDPFLGCWEPGAPIRDIRILDLAFEDLKGINKLGVAMYNWATMELLPLTVDGVPNTEHFLWLKWDALKVHIAG